MDEKRLEEIEKLGKALPYGRSLVAELLSEVRRLRAENSSQWDLLDKTAMSEREIQECIQAAADKVTEIMQSQGRLNDNQVARLDDIHIASIRAALAHRDTMAGEKTEQ